MEPTRPDYLTFQPLEGGGFRLDGGFWGKRQALNREVTVPHGIEMLNEWGSLDNLRIAAGRSDKSYRLPLFMDSDVYKLLEAIAWDRQHGRAEAHERFLAEAAELLAAAQEPDGYLNSYVQVVQAGRRFVDPAMGHEMYCAGHLFQAAVAEARSSAVPGRGPIGEVAAHFAKYLATVLPDMAGYLDGHAEVEMALVEMYREQDDGPSLALADDLVGRRGHGTLAWGSFGPDYFQDDLPVEDAREIRGHAVRALYLLCGVADLYMETGRPELLRASLSQWEDMARAKTYLTGGVGARHEGESFGDPYELPPDHAYCETCAAVASIMWNWRLLLVTGESRFADLLERTLYNGFLAGWGLDGKTFFYVNPLQSRGGLSRKPWYRVACCPPNVMRLVASLEHYVATRTADGVQLQQFMPGLLTTAVAGGELRARVRTSYPQEGPVSVRVEAAPPAVMDFAVRVPSWAREAAVRVNGAVRGVEPGADGYLHVPRRWEAGDELTVDFPLRARVVRPDILIDAVRGSFALERGPFVYCFETATGTGTSGGPHHLEAVQGQATHRIPERRAEVAGEPVVELRVPARALAQRSRPEWPYPEAPPAGPDEADGAEHVTLVAVPYYAWANRGPSQMRVWLPEI